MRILSAAVIAITLSVVACGGDDDTPSPTPTTSASATASTTARPTATTVVSVTPAVTPTPLPPLSKVNSTARLIYNTGPYSFEQLDGPLWISDLTGTQTLALTPDGVSATFAGMTGDPLSGNGSVYYVISPDDDNSAIYRIDFPGGAPQHVLDYTPWEARFSSAALSPGGSQIVYADGYGLQLLDLQTYLVTNLVKGGDKAACLNPVPGGSIHACLAFSRPVWSPDGSRIAIRQTFYEGGQITIVDPSAPGVKPTDAGGCCGATWSPDGDAMCSFGGYDAPTGLFISSAPDWQTTTHTGDFASLYPNAPDKGVDSCSWLAADTLALGISSSGGYPEPDYSYTTMIELSSDQVTNLGPQTVGEQCCGSQVLVVRDAGLVLSQYILQDPDPNVHIPSQPQAIDLATGDAYSLLQPGDWIVAVITP